jgi:hypothetical protein
MRPGEQKCRSSSKEVDIELACVNRARAEDTVVNTPSGVKGLQSRAKLWVRSGRYLDEVIVIFQRANWIP